MIVLIDLRVDIRNSLSLEGGSKYLPMKLREGSFSGPSSRLGLFSQRHVFVIKGVCT